MSDPFATPDRLLDPARLGAVAELALSDAPQQEAFARLNRLAQRLLGVPVSILSVITSDRQVHAGQAGLLDDAEGHSEWPLSHSFCQHVASSGEALVVSDARQHPLVSGNLSVRDHDVVAYAGYPLRLAGGEAVGAFCAIDHQPRQWTGEQLEILKDLTGLAIDLLEHRRVVMGAGTRDSVTGLARPALFAEQLSEMLLRAKVDERVAIVALDLAEFALLNDAWGHEHADALLAEAGLRLEQVANTRSIRGRVCRLGGDTFLVAASFDRAEPRGQLEGLLLRAITGRPFERAGEDHMIGARVATVTATPQVTAPELIQAASSAIQEVRSFDSSPGPRNSASREPALRRLMIRNRLHGAETRGELALAYQPVYDLATRRMTGVEALVRWNHPDLGAVPPNEFVPVAEASGAIVPIGEWVLQTALGDLAAWRATTSGRHLSVAVNVAPEQLLIGAFPQLVGALLDQAGVPSSALSLEITERTLGHDHAVMASNINRLRVNGVRLSLDDFGTGYSSIERLASAPLDELKIDRSFVASLQLAERNSALISGITAMSGALGMDVVAEGIETQEQLDVLTSLGCSHGQGYFLARPSARDHITTLLTGQPQAAGRASSERPGARPRLGLGRGPQIREGAATERRSVDAA